MKRPWNRPSLPVYSISSGVGDERNLNIVTYATAVSMQPKQYVVAIYNGTKTLELVQQNRRFVLQLLSEQQYNLVHLLGQQSGFDINKLARLEKRNLLAHWRGFTVLKDALCWIELSATALVTDKQFPRPDHHLFLCEVISYKNANAGAELTTETLRQKKIVRM
jgi:flavin reductase (DIM6/NTAB) family NADH-FMN oxidoreductase RutF